MGILVVIEIDRHIQKDKYTDRQIDIQKDKYTDR